MILMLIAAMTVSTSFAFRQGPRQITPADRTEKMAQELNLSKKQKAKVLALNEKYADIFAMRGKPGPRQKDCCKKDMQDKQCCKKDTGCCNKGGQHKRPELTPEQKAKMDTMRQKRADYDKELESILNKKQYQTYKENQKKHRGHHGHGPRHDKAPKA